MSSALPNTDPATLLARMEHLERRMQALVEYVSSLTFDEHEQADRWAASYKATYNEALEAGETAKEVVD